MTHPAPARHALLCHTHLRGIRTRHRYGYQWIDLLYGYPLHDTLCGAEHAPRSLDIAALDTIYAIQTHSVAYDTLHIC